MKAAGGVLPPSKPPTGPAPPRRSVCAPAAMSLPCIADQPAMESHPMTSLFSRRSPGKRSAGPRRPTTPLALERLEDRTVPSGYQQLNLVGYQDGMAAHTDPNLNGW